MLDWAGQGRSKSNRAKLLLQTEHSRQLTGLATVAAIPVDAVTNVLAGGNDFMMCFSRSDLPVPAGGVEACSLAMLTR